MMRRPTKIICFKGEIIFTVGCLKFSFESRFFKRDEMRMDGVRKWLEVP